MSDFVSVRAENGVTYLRAKALAACPHGFSTRIGGVSTHPETASLNLGIGFADDEVTVRRNLALFGEAVGFAPETLISGKQIHSVNVRTVTAADAGLGYDRTADFACDGYVTCERGVTLGVRTADCVPILAAAIDDAGHPYAVGAFHAGWRGTVAGIAVEGVQKMLALGVHLEHIRVAMGPCIRPCCFEIDDAARDVFLLHLGEVHTHAFVHPTRAGHYHADLHGINRALMEEAGVLPAHIAASDACTMCDCAFFYSYRRNGRARGSMLSVICLPK